MEVFRLARQKYTKLLSGKGAAIKGARWNSPGVELIYTAANRSLAMAEVAVHLTLATLPDDFMMLTIELPDDISHTAVSRRDLPIDWNVFPHPTSTQAIGDRFIFAGKYCVLRAPSAVTQGDYNVLINPHHSEFARVRIVRTEKFPFDKRIFIR